MGCVFGRKSLKFEEIALTDIEDNLEYQSHKVLHSDLIIRKHSYEGKINLNQWTNIAEELNIKIRNTSKCPYIEEFYVSIMDSTFFHLKDLLILSIFLGTGSSSHKARLLYEAYHNNTEKSISKQFLLGLFEDIARIFIGKIQILIGNVNYAATDMYEIKMYMNNLMMKSSIAKQDFVDLFCKDNENITYLEYKNVLESQENSYLLTSYGFRSFVSKSKINRH